MKAIQSKLVLMGMWGILMSGLSGCILHELSVPEEVGLRLQAGPIDKIRYLIQGNHKRETWHSACAFLTPFEEMEPVQLQLAHGAAKDLQDGRDALTIFRKDLAREKMQRAAENGLLMAMTELAELYRDGIGGPRDLNKFLEWSGRAASLGCPKAEFILGESLARGNEEFRDYIRGLAWVRVAYDSGYLDGHELFLRLTGVMDEASINKAIALAARTKAAIDDLRGSKGLELVVCKQPGLPDYTARRRNCMGAGGKAEAF